MILGTTLRRFSAGMAIVNIILRPLTGFFLYKILLQERPMSVKVTVTRGTSSSIPVKKFGTFSSISDATSQDTIPQEAHEILQLVPNLQEGNNNDLYN